MELMELYEDIAQDKITKHEQTKDMILDAMKSFIIYILRNTHQKAMS